jgi:hypothetical protein
MTLDLTQPVWLYDDRSMTDDILPMTGVLWQGRIDGADYAVIYSTALDKTIEQPLLCALADGQILNSDYDSWYATNDISKLG